MSGGRRQEIRQKTRGTGQAKENEIGPEGAQYIGKNVRTEYPQVFMWIHMHLHQSRRYLTKLITS